MSDGLSEAQASPERGRKLLSVAQQSQWDVESALAWEELELHRLGPFVRRAMADVHRSTLHAESLAFTLVDRLVDLAPEGLLRDFSRTQRVDEARHVAFFTRIVGQLSDETRPTPLVALEKELSEVHDFDEIMVHAQVIETAGQVLFAGTTKRAAALMRPGVRLPGSTSVAAVLGCIRDRVASDEARHVAFATWYVQCRFRELDAPRRRALLERASVSAKLTCEAFASLAPAYARLGIDVAELLTVIRRRVKSQLERLEERPVAGRADPGGATCD